MPFTYGVCEYKRGMKILGIIPARYGSTRLPGKALIRVQGKTIIERVYRRVQQSQHLDTLIIATDDVRIFNHARKFGAEAAMTRQDHESGTSRCAEVLESYPGFDVIVNIQGDEPLINPAQVDQLCELMAGNPEVAVGTLVRKIDQVADLSNPAIAKVVMGADGRVLYFSRNAIPFVRDIPQEQWLGHAPFYKHVGMYAYRKDILHQIGALRPGALEKAEKLEQLNWLVNGIAVYAAETEYTSLGVDTPEDLETLERLLAASESHSG